MLTYQPFIGGSAPLFPDYIVFGAFQWVRIMSPYQMLAKDDPVPTGSSAASTCTAGSGEACRGRLTGLGAWQARQPPV